MPVAEHSRCPICGRDVPARAGGAGFGPLFSARCRAVDLGSWLDGRYRIGSALSDEEVDAPSSPDAQDADDKVS